MEYEWDLEKEELNIKKHGCSFSEATETFRDPLGIPFKDIKHSIMEARYYWIGKTFKGRILTTRFTIRDEKIRIIGSAEWRQMRKIYEDAQSEES